MVRPQNAMAVSTVFACVRLLGETLGAMPWEVYRRVQDDPRRKELATDHYLWKTLHEKPNVWQTPLEWKEMGMAHLALRGNFYNLITLSPDNEIGLVPLNPDRVTVDQLQNYTLRYTYKPQSGPPKTYIQGEIFHVRGMSFNGIQGVSVLEYARNAVGSAIAQETHGSALFDNGGLPSFWISRPTPMSADARRNWRLNWRRIQGGPQNAGNPPILDSGMELHALGLSNRDSQWIESRAFQGYEICRFFRVPPHLVYYLDRSTYNNIEQQSLEFVMYTLGPWAARWDMAANRDLLDNDQEYYVKTIVESLLRGDRKSRYEAHQIAINGGWKTRNEVREEEGLGPLEGLDEPLEPLNMVPAGSERGQSKNTNQQQADKKDFENESKDSNENDNEDANASFDKISPLLASACQRIVDSEIRILSKRADKAAEDRERWNAWARDEAYATIATVATKILSPVFSTCEQFTGHHFDIEASVSSIIKSSEPIFVTSDVPAMLDQWKTERAEAITATLLQGVNHVQAI